jgi:hypothetical protein
MIFKSIFKANCQLSVSLDGQASAAAKITKTARTDLVLFLLRFGFANLTNQIKEFF